MQLFLAQTRCSCWHVKFSELEDTHAMREYRLNAVSFETFRYVYVGAHISQFDGIDSLSLTETPIPALAPSQVLVKIHAVSLQVCAGCAYISEI